MAEINKFGNFRQILKPLWGEPLADLIRKITGRDLPTFVLMGLSEATVISIVDGYYCYKFQMSYLSESDIFRRIIKARMYNSETEQKLIKKEPQTLIEFIENILEAEGQNNELSQESIEKLIVKYCEVREITL